MVTEVTALSEWPEPPARNYPHARLSPRERQVLGLLEQGMSGKEMTLVLGLSSNTVRSYCESLLRKLDSTSRLKALARARTYGLL